MKFMINIHRIKAETKEAVDFIVGLLKLRQYETVKGLSLRSMCYIVSPVELASKLSLPPNLVLSELSSVNYTVAELEQSKGYAVFVAIPELGFAVSPNSVKNMTALEVADDYGLISSFSGESAFLFLSRITSNSALTDESKVKAFLHSKDRHIVNLSCISDCRSEVDFSDDVVFVNYRSILSASAETLIQIRKDDLPATKFEPFDSLSYFLVRDSFLVETWYLATDSQIKALLG